MWSATGIPHSTHTRVRWTGSSGQRVATADNPDSFLAKHGEGVVTSGSLSPCLETGIGMAYVPSEDREPGTELEVDVRGKLRKAEVRDRPLYKRKETSG